MISLQMKAGPADIQDRSSAGNRSLDATVGLLQATVQLIFYNTVQESMLSWDQAVKNLKAKS